MRPLDRLSAEEAQGLAGIVFDLDDTLLDHGELTELAFGSLFRLREAGLRLIACTGRPAGWGEVVQRQWPIDATIVENGAIAFTAPREAGGARKLAVIDALDRAARAARRAELMQVAGEIVARFPATGLADDNDARRADVTLDIGEHRRVALADVRAIRAIARDRGLRTFVSSIHLHLTCEPDDKGSAAVRVLGHVLGEDATRARARYAFVGDSANDAAAFAAFRCTFGVANVRAQLHGLTVPPRYVARAAMGAGFAEIAAQIVALRASCA